MPNRSPEEDLASGPCDAMSAIFYVLRSGIEDPETTLASARAFIYVAYIMLLTRLA